MSGYSSLRYEDWLRGWREWARTRKRGKMAQFIVEKLEEGNQAQWLSIERGLFELTEWHAIAKEWFGEKPRNSEEVDAPCMLRKGLPRAFPGLDEVKEKSRKEGTQYRSRVFKAPQSLMNDVLLHITNTPGAAYIQNGGTAPDHVPFYPNTYFGNATSNDSTANPVTTSGPYYPLNHQLMGAGTGAAPEFNNSPTNATSSVHGVDVDLQHTNSHNPDYHHHHHHHQQQPQPQQFVTHPDGHDYFQQQRTTSYTNEDIDMYVQRITENGVNGGSSGSSGVAHPPSNSSSNGLFSPPTSVGMLGVPSPSYQLKEEMGSPPSGPPPYGTSPASTHSPRISPEPSMLGSYPPSVQQQQPQQSNIVTGSEMSPGTCSSTSPAVPPVEPEMMKVKVNPNSSPLEGGGQMVLLFYNPLPLGNKMVVFCSQKNLDLAYAQEAFQENMMALVCQIPEFPYPEEVELRVYNFNQIIARTTFTFYQRTIQMPPPSDMILQILSSQLQSHFPGSNNGGSGTANGGSNGDQMSGGYGYIPNSMYQLLLGACRLGCEPLVHCLLSSPVMEELSLDQIKEAYQCANSNGHESLSDLLMELVVLHDMTPTAAPMPQYLSRGIGNNPVETKKHVPAYYSVVDELQQGGGTPQARAETVLKQLLEAMKNCKEDQSAKNEDDVTTTENTLPVSDKDGEETSDGNVGGSNNKDGITTPIIEITPNLGNSVKELAVQMEQTSLSGPPPPRRRLSSSAKLTRQSNSISDEDDEIRHSESSLKSPAVMHSRESWAEVDDIVPDLVPHKTKHPYTQQSDADSAIGGMSFDEDINNMINPEAQRRRSSMLLPSDGFSSSDAILLKLNSDQGLEIANSLEYEGHIIVTEDYPSDHDKKIFCKGDRILQVGDKSIRGMSVVEFSEFFQSEASAGTIVKVIPSPTSPGSLSESSSGTPQQKALKRTFSEQCPTDTVKSRINQFLSSKSFGADRKVTLSRSGNGYPIKMIGGKMVGIFVSDGDVTTQHIFPGDEILELNGISTRGMSLYDANHIVQSSVGELNLLVAENRNKYSRVRELVEVDSIYLRSLVEQKSTTSRDMALQKGTLLRVVNIYGLPNYWVAWCIDESTGMETQLKRILPPSVAKRQFNCDAYERLERHDSTFPRPLCISGPSSDKVAQLIADKPQFNLCTSAVDILGVCSKGSGHAVMSVTEPEQLAVLNVLQPIVLQTPSDSATLTEQAKYTRFPVNSYLNGTSCSDMAEQAVGEIKSLQSLPIWKSIGVM